MEDQELVKLLIGKLATFERNLQDCQQTARNTTFVAQQVRDVASNALSSLQAIAADHLAVNSRLEECLQDSREGLIEIGRELEQDASESNKVHNEMIGTFSSHCQPSLTLVPVCADTYLSNTNLSHEKLAELTIKADQVITLLQSLCGEVESSSRDASQNIVDIQTKIDNLLERIDREVQGVATEVNRQTDGLRQKVADYSSLIENTSRDLASKHGQLFQQTVSESITSMSELAIKEAEYHFRPLVDQVLETIENTIEKLRTSISSSQEESSVLRQAIEPLIEELDSIREPLNEVANNVKNLADKVSIKNFFGLFG